MTACKYILIFFNVVVGLFIHHVKSNVELDDGDFFGLLGILLMLCLVLVYDATGVYHLYRDAKEANIANIEKLKEFDTNEYCKHL
jgi:hypothetical protein